VRSHVKMLPPLLAFLLFAIGACDHATLELAGVVQDATGPIGNAIVRVQGTTLVTQTDADGRFILRGIEARAAVSVSASAPGYYIGGGESFLPNDDANIMLTRHRDDDNSDYIFTAAYSSADEKGSNCQLCHAEKQKTLGLTLFDDWAESTHARSAKNPRFLTMYGGTDIDGNQSPETHYSYTANQAKIPLPPDMSRPYFGPGYRLDFPNTAGNCSTCHVPTLALRNPAGADPRNATGVDAEGVGCDICHKMWQAKLDSTTGLPVTNRPGVFSFEFRRPFSDRQFFAGPLDDVAPGDDVHAPQFKKSQICAPCHAGSFWGTPIYNSFGEWLTATANGANTKSCQDCHMPPPENGLFAKPAVGGIRRDPRTLSSHRFRGPRDLDFLRGAIDLQASASHQGSDLSVQVTITNTAGGHRLPTGNPMRHLIVWVDAQDMNGISLNQTNGPKVPTWAGVGAVSEGNYGGKPGMIYAKVLKEDWTDVSPTAAYWNFTRIVSDNRLAQGESDTTTYVFAAPATTAQVKVTLLYRSAFKKLATQKGWKLEDIVISQKTAGLFPGGTN
jgi:hypothetical protein